MLSDFSEIFGRVSVNLNGDLSSDELTERARGFEKAGVKIVWVGEFEGFEDPFRVAEVIATSTSLLIGFGILSPLRRGCGEIRRRVAELEEEFGRRFYVALAPGNRFENPKEAVDVTVKCARGMNAFVGVSSPYITKEASKSSPGLLVNYVKPDFVRWIRGFMRRRVFTASYGPALILPSEFEEDLLIAASIVFTGSGKLINAFHLQHIAAELGRMNIERLVEIRRRGESIKDVADVLFKHREFLLQNFTISGSYESVVGRIKNLLTVSDHVILADPFFRDRKSIKFLRNILRECEGF